jgi:hypothetical protein
MKGNLNQSGILFLNFLVKADKSSCFSGIRNSSPLQNPVYILNLQI